VLGRVVFSVVDAHDDGFDVAFAGGGDDDLNERRARQRERSEWWPSAERAR
jgi:hypothetical protein